MFELLTLFLTGGGSAAMGSILKGVFGAMTDARQQKYEMEMAREARNNEFAIQFQQALNSGPGGAFTRATRRMLAQHSRSSPASRQSTQAFRSSVQQTLPGKEKKSFFSDLSVFQQSKPLWSLQRDISLSLKQP